MAHASKTQASQSCYDRLRAAIIYCQVPPGQRLRESTWAATLGVHRSACRQAMALLCHEGLLRAGERGGYFTPVYEQADLQQIWETRRALETAALDRLMQERDRSEVVAAMTSTVQAMEQLLALNLALGYVEADRRFHQQMVQGAGNAHLASVYDKAALPLILEAAELETLVRNHAAKTLQEHRDLVAFIDKGKSTQALALLKRHLHGEAPAGQLLPA